MQCSALLVDLDLGYSNDGVVFSTKSRGTARCRHRSETGTASQVRTIVPQDHWQRFNSVVGLNHAFAVPAGALARTDRG
jgi:hypothetical protein